MNNKNNNAIPAWQLVAVIILAIIAVRIATISNLSFNLVIIIIALIFLGLGILAVLTIIANSYMKKHRWDVVRLNNNMNNSHDLEDYFTNRDGLIMHLSKMAKTQFMIEKNNRLSEKPSSLLTRLKENEELHMHTAIMRMTENYKTLVKETGYDFSDTFSEKMAKYAPRLSAENLKEMERCLNVLRDYEAVVGKIEETDGMEGHEFEYWCADLLKNNGFSNVEVTRGSGDQGVDVLAEKGGIRYAVQCKCYASDLSNKPVQEVHAGKAMYHCQIGAVITNRYFTAGAKELAEANGVLLWDRDELIRMLDNQNARLTES